MEKIGGKMKKTIYEYKKIGKELINNKIFIISVILVTILSFGFTITHYSIGIDDTCFDRYYLDKEMLGIGRWGAYVIYMILGIVEFTPFWADLMATLVILCTAVLWCIFFKKNLKCEIPNFGYIVFAGLYISFPIVNEMFIYQNCNIAVMLGNLLVVAGVMLLYENYIIINKKYIYSVCIAMITFGISTYEASIQMGLVGIFITAYLIIKNKELETKKIIKYILCAIGILAISAILNIMISKVIYLMGIPVSDIADKEIKWGKYTFIESILTLIYHILSPMKNLRYFPVIIFDIACIVGLIMVVIKAYKNNNVLGLLIYLAMFFSNFAIVIIKLDSIMYRTCLSWGLFVAFIFTVFYLKMTKKEITKILSTIVLIVLILQQSRMLNQLFFNDYKRYQRDLNIAFNLINELEKNYDIKKPLVIAGKPRQSWSGGYGAQVNSLSVLWWGQKAFHNGEEFIKFLNSLGYYFKVPTDEQYQKGKNKAKNMENYPREGSIVELEDCIVINF